LEVCYSPGPGFAAVVEAIARCFPARILVELTRVGFARRTAQQDFQILAADYFPDELPSLATLAGKAAIEALLDGVTLVVIHNISKLAAIGHDNDAESWTPVQGWLLRLRRKGMSVLLVHHAGKGGLS
jgi:putative DNA primase/helicase